MYKTLLSALLSILAFPAAAQITVSGAANPPVRLDADPNTGLSAVYVVDNTAGCSYTYTASSSRVSVQRFRNLGGGYAEDIPGLSHSGNTYTIPADTEDTGYIIDDGDSRVCFWVVNYANHALALDALAVLPDDSDCSRVALALSGSAAPITYYSVNGRAVQLSRDLTLSYLSLVYDEDSQSWLQSPQSVSLPGIDGAVHVNAPLCDTDFSLSGDRFTQAWGDLQYVSSSSYTAVAVSAHVRAVQAEHVGADNESGGDLSDGLGGSAPCEVTFSAQPTDAAVFREWQFSTTEDFENITDRYNVDELTFSFTDEGVTYVRFQCADASGVCSYDSEVFTVTIGASKLLIPNAFSPHNQDGVNDLWKVSYTSIVKFECSIFNRWGQRLATLTHPSQGWDGRYKGKFVPAGVYFYVIKAVGADGKSYDRAGDINIVTSRLSPATPQDPSTDPPTD